MYTFRANLWMPPIIVSVKYSEKKNVFFSTPYLNHIVLHCMISNLICNPQSVRQVLSKFRNLFPFSVNHRVSIFSELRRVRQHSHNFPASLLNSPLRRAPSLHYSHTQSIRISWLHMPFHPDRNFSNFAMRSLLYCILLTCNIYSTVCCYCRVKPVYTESVLPF